MNGNSQPARSTPPFRGRVCTNWNLWRPLLRAALCLLALPGLPRCMAAASYRVPKLKQASALQNSPSPRVANRQLPIAMLVTAAAGLPGFELRVWQLDGELQLELETHTGETVTAIVLERRFQEADGSETMESVSRDLLPADSASIQETLPLSRALKATVVGNRSPGWESVRLVGAATLTGTHALTAWAGEELEKIFKRRESLQLARHFVLEGLDHIESSYGRTSLPFRKTQVKILAEILATGNVFAKNPRATTTSPAARAYLRNVARLLQALVRDPKTAWAILRPDFDSGQNDFRTTRVDFKKAFKGIQDRIESQFRFHSSQVHFDLEGKEAQNLPPQVRFRR